MTNPICIYHDKCLDGMAAAWIVQKAFPNTLFIPLDNDGHDADLREVIGNVAPNWMEENLDIFVVDFSFPRDTMIWLSKNCNLAVLDHHKSAMEDCEGLDFCQFDMNQSGATMAHQYFFPEDELPIFLRYVRDGDLWLFEEPCAQEIRAYMHSWPYSFDSCTEIDNTLNNPMLFLNARDQGAAILRHANTLVDIMTRDICIAQIGGFDVPVVNASCLASQVTHKMCKDWPQYPFVASYYDNTKKGIRMWRLTSIGEFDVSVIAKIYGGGGHVNAAGFQQILDKEQVEQ